MTRTIPTCVTRAAVLVPALALLVGGCTPPPNQGATEQLEAGPNETASGEEASAPAETPAAPPAPAPPAREASRPAPPAPAAPPPDPVPAVAEEQGASPPEAPVIVEVEIPEGTVLELELLTPLDTSVNRAGDEIQARTRSPLYVRGEQVLGAGALVEGRVTEVQASGRVKGRAKLGFTFDRLATGTGMEKVRTSFVEQEADSGQKKDAAVIGGAAGVGAIVGGIIGGKKGAAIGASIGGAGGSGVVLSTRGEEIRLPVGTELNVRLEEGVTIERH